MNNRSISSLASFVTGLVAIGILAVSVPAIFWNFDGVAATLTLFFALATPALWPRGLSSSRLSDAASIGMVGPLGSIWAVLVCLGIGQVVCCLFGWSIAARVLGVIWLGTYVVGFLTLRAATNVISAASTQTQSATVDARSRWLSQLRLLEARAELAPVRASLSALMEKVQYAANDKLGSSVDVNRKIDSFLDDMPGALSVPDEFSKLISKTEVALMQREHNLLAARTQT